MKKATLLLLMCCGVVSAQYGPVGHLTIFSEDGDKFWLVLNGERQNDQPQTNLRVEDLNQPYYSAKIIFEDKSLQEITKNNLAIADVDGAYADVTYKIKHDRNNKTKMKLNYFSMVPVQPNYIPPANVYVVHYGTPQPPVRSTTTTTTTMGTGVNASVNVGGINMNVNVNDPNTVTQTTTTHTSSSTYDDGPRHNPDSHSGGCPRRYAMAPGDFNSALATIKNQGFDDTKLSTAKQIASANCLNASQVAQIAKEFGFEESRLDFAKFAYDHCTEPGNYFKVNNVFDFSSSVDSLNDYIQARQ